MKQERGCFVLLVLTVFFGVFVVSCKPEDKNGGQPTATPDLQWQSPLPTPESPTPLPPPPASMAIEFLIDESASVVGGGERERCPANLSIDKPFHKVEVDNVFHALSSVFSDAPSPTIYIGLGGFGDDFHSVLAPVMAKDLANNENKSIWNNYFEESNSDGSTHYGTGFRDAYNQHLRELQVERKLMFVLTDGFNVDPENGKSFDEFLSELSDPALEIYVVLLCPNNAVENFWGEKTRVQVIEHDDWARTFFSDIDLQISIPHGWVGPNTKEWAPLFISGDSLSATFHFRSLDTDDDESLCVVYQRDAQEDSRYISSGNSQTFILSPDANCSKHQFDVGKNSSAKGFWWAVIQMPLYRVDLEDDIPLLLLNNQQMQIKATISGLGTHNQQWRQCYIPELRIDNENLPQKNLEQMVNGQPLIIPFDGSAYVTWRWTPEEFISPARIPIEAMLKNKDGIVVSSDQSQIQVAFQAVSLKDLNNAISMELDDGYTTAYRFHFFFDYDLRMPRVVILTGREKPPANVTCPSTRNRHRWDDKWAYDITPNEALPYSAVGLVRLPYGQLGNEYVVDLPPPTIDPEKCGYTQILFIWDEQEGILHVTWSFDWEYDTFNDKLIISQPTEIPQ